MNYPEHEKLKALNGRNVLIGGFLEWLEEQGLAICERTGEYPWTPTRKRFEQMIAEFFDIDLVKLEQEKRAMLEELRRAQP